jgi:hypothetical protein
MAEDLPMGTDGDWFERGQADGNLAPALAALRLGVELLAEAGPNRVDRESLILLLRAAAAQAGQRALPFLQQATGDSAG